MKCLPVTELSRLRQLEKKEKEREGRKRGEKRRKREGKEKKSVAPNMLLHFHGSHHFCERD
jgi:hypothetical protein